MLQASNISDINSYFISFSELICYVPCRNQATDIEITGIADIEENVWSPRFAN